MAQRVTADGLVEIARAAIRACEGGRLTAAALAEAAPDGEVWVVGAGKAVAAMAAGARRALGDRARFGPLIGKHAEGDETTADPPVMFAGHPLPDHRGAIATSALIEFVAA